MKEEAGTGRLTFEPKESLCNQKRAWVESVPANDLFCKGGAAHARLDKLRGGQFKSKKPRYDSVFQTLVHYEQVFQTLENEECKEMTLERNQNRKERETKVRPQWPLPSWNRMNTANEQNNTKRKLNKEHREKVK